MRKFGWVALLFAAAIAGAAERPDEDLDAAQSAQLAERFAGEFAAYAETVLDAARDTRNARVAIAAAAFAAHNPWRETAPALAARRDALVARARALGADDPVVWWVLASDWPGLPPRERERAVRHLRQLAPNNAAGWLLVADDADDTDANFLRAAQSNRFDLYEGEYVRALHAAASLVPAPEFALEQTKTSEAVEREAQARLIVALGKWTAHALPPLREVNERCNGTLALSGSRLQECLALSRLMANRSRNVLLQRVGTTLLLARSPQGDERSAVEAARRRLDWMLERSAPLASGEGWAISARRWLDPDGDEFAVTRTLLERHGVPLEPPAGWRSQSRAVLPALPAD